VGVLLVIGHLVAGIAGVVGASQMISGAAIGLALLLPVGLQARASRSSRETQSRTSGRQA
jgi:hypothetical protein